MSEMATPSTVKKWQPGERAIIAASGTPCEIDGILAEMWIGVWVPSRRNVLSYRVVNPIELEPPP
jgi:hypothetical protein